MARSRYYLLGKIGQGQFGRVYCAIDRVTGEIIALKDLDQKGYPTNKLLKEISYLISLRHPNIVSFRGLQHHKTGRYLLMDYCEGGNLRELMESGGKLSISQCLNFILQILAGLSHAHAQGIVHCDIKPENILLTVGATGWTAKISDFGISRLTKDAEWRRQSGGYTGSPAYMAPERFYGRYSPASDLYAVGILLYELLADCRPFSGLPAELMTAHMTKTVKIPDTIPYPLRSIVDIALRKLPQRRFESAKAMAKEIEIAMRELTFDRYYFIPSMPLNPPKIPITDDVEKIDRRGWENIGDRITGKTLLILNRRYGVTLQVSKRNTKLEIINRRGNTYTTTVLPFPLQHITRNGFNPYQFLGIDPEPDPFAILVDLKPFKVTRIPLNFLPDRVSFHERGFLVANDSVSIRLDLDREL